MSHEERTGQRDLTYSRWHRPAQISRLIGRRVAALLTTIDIDFCEACNSCNEPVALIETQHSDGPPKRAPITQKLAKRAGLPAYSVSYRTDEWGEIVNFAVRQIQPPSADVQTMLPQVYAYWLWSLRAAHIVASEDCADSIATALNHHHQHA